MCRSRDFPNPAPNAKNQKKIKIQNVGNVWWTASAHRLLSPIHYALDVNALWFFLWVSLKMILAPRYIVAATSTRKSQFYANNRHKVRVSIIDFLPSRGTGSESQRTQSCLVNLTPKSDSTCHPVLSPLQVFSILIAISVNEIMLHIDMLIQSSHKPNFYIHSFRTPA